MKQKEDEHKTLKEKIAALLPQALTAGLSYAYGQKREAEEREKQSATKVFRLYIGLMALVACIPLLVLAYLYGCCDMAVADVLLRAPKLVFTILPLYAPLVWLAVVANKKINLSKRLIEEYSHKETLSKTVEGLAHQIDSLPDEKISQKLREQLLFNIVNVSAENPGKLISNYDRSDNPIMEILEKSESLGKCLEKYGKLPGLSFVVKNLSKKNDKVAQETEANIEIGLKSTEDSAE